MKTVKKENELQNDPVAKQVEASEQQDAADDQSENRKNKKKHNSALAAAEKARSAVSHADHHANKDIDFGHTGTNFDYR